MRLFGISEVEITRVDLQYSCIISLKRSFRAFQIIVILNFVVLSSAGVKMVDCKYIYIQAKCFLHVTHLNNSKSYGWDILIRWTDETTTEVENVSCLYLVKTYKAARIDQSIMKFTHVREECETHKLQTESIINILLPVSP